MRRLLSKRHSQGGFTLIEVMVALTIFLIVSLGVMPLFLTSIRGSALSRTHTVGKNVVVKAAERARGFPYHIAYSAQQQTSSGIDTLRKRDVLDLFFPSAIAATPTGYDSSRGVYVTVCDDSAAAVSNPACPRELPDNSDVTFEARFVQPVPDAAGNDEYQTVLPAANYVWNPSPYNGEDFPPSPLMELSIRGEWVFGADPQEFETVTIIANREFGETTVRGLSRVDYGIQVTTGFVASSGDDDDDEGSANVTELLATGGSSESRIETKTASSADQLAQGAQLLLNDPDLTDPVESVTGAVSNYHAPPDTTSGTQSAGPASLVHPEFGVGVAGFDDHSANNLGVAVGDDLPTASGEFNFPDSLAADDGENLFWVTNFEGDDSEDDLHLDVSRAFVRVQPRGGDALLGWTTAATTPVSDPNRSIQTTAHLDIGRVHVLPLQISQVQDELGNQTIDRAVVIVDDFEAHVDCMSTASGSATATFDWSARIRYLEDSRPEDGVALAKYTALNVSGSDGSNPIAPIANPLVYDAVDPDDDIYLFEAAGKRGYVRSMTTAWGSNRLSSSVDATGRETEAGIDGAIQIVTAPTDPDVAGSTMSISIGKLTCEASDQR